MTAVNGLNFFSLFLEISSSVVVVVAAAAGVWALLSSPTPRGIFPRKAAKKDSNNIVLSLLSMDDEAEDL